MVKVKEVKNVLKEVLWDARGIWFLMGIVLLIAMCSACALSPWQDVKDKQGRVLQDSSELISVYAPSSPEKEQVLAELKDPSIVQTHAVKFIVANVPDTCEDKDPVLSELKAFNSVEKEIQKENE